MRGACFLSVEREHLGGHAHHAQAPSRSWRAFALMRATPSIHVAYQNAAWQEARVAAESGIDTAVNDLLLNADGIRPWGMERVAGGGRFHRPTPAARNLSKNARGAICWWIYCDRSDS